MIPSAWLRLFNPKEVNELLSGGEGGGVDAADMQRHATYSGGYSADSQTIKLFWKVLASLLAQTCRSCMVVQGSLTARQLLPYTHNKQQRQSVEPTHARSHPAMVHSSA